MVERSFEPTTWQYFAVNEQFNPSPLKPALWPPVGCWPCNNAATPLLITGFAA